MSIEHTAEDFAGASFARHPGTGATACRVAGAKGGPAWTTEDLAETTDEDMARDGWVPVVESRVTEHTLRDSQAAAERKRQRLLDHIADQDGVIRRRNDEITALRRELADAQAPLSLDRLAAAWEAAEVPTKNNPVREGDVVIVRNPDPEEFSVFTWPGYGYSPDEETRILSRAPREPWADLADVLMDYDGSPDPAHAAPWLHKRGVRVTGGDDDE